MTIADSMSITKSHDVKSIFEYGCSGLNTYIRWITVNGFTPKWLRMITNT